MVCVSLPHRGPRAGRGPAGAGTLVGVADSRTGLEREPEGRRSLFDWAFRNRQTGRITVAQFPNVALWIFFVTVVVRWVVPVRGAVRTAVDAIAVAALAAWALDEVFRGVNPWRRLLGLAGCAFVVSG